MPKPSEPTERDRELAALCTIGICSCDEYTCAPHRDIAEACRRARAEEREAILAEISAYFGSTSGETWITLVELKKRIEARGKEADAPS